MPWTAFIDGGSRGNPGPAAAGVEIRDPSGRVHFAGGLFLGRMTNNQAEYHGLLAAIEHLTQAGAADVSIASDSELMVRQINGQYRVRSPELLPLYERSIKGLRGLGRWSMRHVPRNQNKAADALANKAMDRAADVIEVRAGAAAEAPAAETRGAPAARRGESRQDNPAPPTAHPAGALGPGRAVEAVVIRDGGKACRVKMRRGDAFTFGETTPNGMCLHACAAVLEVVLALREQDEADEEPVTVSCGHAGCPAAFEVRRRPARWR